VAKSSTRKQITNEGRKMLYDVENAMFRLKRIEELGEGHSPVITESVPHLLQLLEMAHGFVESFRAKL